MITISNPHKPKKISILSLGAESEGNFSIYHNGEIYFSENFGDLLNDNNFKKFQKTVLGFLKKELIKPAVILTDLHPLYKTTLWGQELAKQLKAKPIAVQHHVAHIFSAMGENPTKTKTDIYGIALDGTGYGLDGKIWGGEILKISKAKIEKIGGLENQTMIGGDLAVKEPARMLMAILSKSNNKERIYGFIKKFYTRNQFELLYNQLQQNFNCQETSSTGRVLDAASILLELCINKRKYKHEPTLLLEKNSTKPYSDLRPTIKDHTLLTTPLFEYLIKNLHKNKKRLAATAQRYIAQGLYEVLHKSKAKKIYFSGGLANNKIIYEYLASKGAIANQKIPRGDAGISFGQLSYYMLTNPRD